MTKDGWKSRKGVAKVRTEKPLDIKKRSGHEQAQSKWFEASKAQNLDKWVKLAGAELAEEVKDELK